MSIKEFIITFPSDYTSDVVHEMASFMNIPIDDTLFETALFEENPKSVNNIAKFYDPSNKENLIVIRCFDDDTFHYLIVRVEDSQFETVKYKLLEIDTRMRKAVGQKILSDLKDYSTEINRGLHLLEKEYKVTF